jgi:hypothetical protein
MRTKATLEVRLDSGEWSEVARVCGFGDACLLADGVTLKTGGRREYRAIERHPSGGSVEYIGRLPANAKEG